MTYAVKGQRVLWVALADNTVVPIEYDSGWQVTYPRYEDFKYNFSRGFGSPVTHLAETEGNCPAPGHWVVNEVKENSELEASA